jgi:hypothetical protein
MRIYHNKCNTQVDIVTTKIEVRVLEVGITGEDTVEPALLDLVAVKTGGYSVSCPKCKEKDLSMEDVSIPCIRCGGLVPLSKVYSVKPDWSLLCESCSNLILKKLSSGSGAELKSETVSIRFK